MKAVRIEVTESRWKSPKKRTAAFGEQLTQQKFSVLDVQPSTGPLPAGTSLETIGTFDDGIPQDQYTTAPPPNVIIPDDNMTIDSIGAGRTVEEDLDRIGNSFYPSFRVDFYRAVWFDSLETIQLAHWTRSGDAIVPTATLIDDTVVRGRYVIR